MRKLKRFLGMAATGAMVAGCAGGGAAVHQGHSHPGAAPVQHSGGVQKSDGGVTLPPTSSTNTPKGTGRLLVKYKTAADEKHSTTYRLLGPKGWGLWVKVNPTKLKTGIKKTALTYGIEFDRTGQSFENPPAARTVDVESRAQTDVLVFYTKP